ncbi:hypothetical protein [Empedobacter sp. GD03865]|uniref:hypothetical protein n=1 Tax=Empedobacter sp. GD03865 TaxID=2975392 RepID=UPI00244890B6|nr:hypothetical protein [Empedobacter sp. GD03865]MDH0659579.1 hypothetical protein [Empedobacter sp. GD03865]
MIKILFAYDLIKNDNEYVERLVEIVESIEDYEVSKSLSEFWNPINEYDFVVINWPEYLFNWRKDLNKKDLDKLNDRIDFYKDRGTKVISLVHDEYAHHSRTKERDIIFDICYSKSDILAHLGEYSKKMYEDRYSNLPIKHFLLYHPLFKKFNFKQNILEARKVMNFPQNSRIIFVPGGIREEGEYELVKKIFNLIELKNKVLVIQKLSYQQPIKRFSLGYFKQKIYYSYLKYFKKIIIGPNKFIQPDILSNYFSASNIIFLPRYKILNSGNVVLANQYGKKIIGFETGNITEWLHLMNDIVLKTNYNQALDLEKLDLNKNPVEFLKLHNDNIIKQQFLAIINSI